jgi:hypothetical protein
LKRGQLGAAVGAVAALGLLLWWSRPFLPAPAARADTRLDGELATRASTEPGVPVTTTVTSLGGSAAAASTCTGAFVTHRLPFATGTRLREIGTYISNGAGVAANDLDADGDLDLVFASIDGANTILWNEGRRGDTLEFTPEELDDRFSRAVAVVDADGDGLLDITFTHRGLDSLSYWRNTGDAAQRFVRADLPGVDGFAYAMAWGDLDLDGDLDLVTGSYAAELKQHGIANPAEDPRAGVALYTRQGEGFTRQQLDPHAETLSIGVLDLDGDARPEIWVANDFAARDAVWQRHEGAWVQTEPFAATSHSTMSTEWGDLGNDGRLALFSTDMNPYDIAPQTLAKWLPMMKQLGEWRAANDPQLMANVLLVTDSAGSTPGPEAAAQVSWHDIATARGVSATGWSWAGRFGDLDRDGLLDLYVVNGMIAADMFGYLPNHELVEENQAFQNRGGTFVPAPAWQLGSTASGRGMVMADLDADGDLDIVVNNLRGFAQWFENRLCGGQGLEVILQQPPSTAQEAGTAPTIGANTGAIGAVARLITDRGVQRRDLRASGGYLSGDPLRLYFGLPPGAAAQALEITWPDGAVSRVANVAAGTQMVVTRR